MRKIIFANKRVEVKRRLLKNLLTNEGYKKEFGVLNTYVIDENGDAEQKENKVEELINDIDNKAFDILLVDSIHEFEMEIDEMNTFILKLDESKVRLIAFKEQIDSKMLLGRVRIYVELTKTTNVISCIKVNQNSTEA